MGLTKTEIFTEEQNKIATMAKALGHPARIAILQFLLSSDRCVTGDLVTELGLAQSTISQHLKELKQLGLIQGSIEGTSVCYCLCADVWQDVKNTLGNFIVEVCQNKACC
ncbi:MAG: DNA-binding transcriptional ArsR family regulator [Flavobacteriales bacterium]|jgi:DNA-binding transcriptional ArsR family regulator